MGSRENLAARGVLSVTVPSEEGSPLLISGTDSSSIPVPEPILSPFLLARPFFAAMPTGLEGRFFVEHGGWTSDFLKSLIREQNVHGSPLWKNRG